MDYGHINDWVVTRDGRIGLIVAWSERKAEVQFGSGGPFQRHWWGDLRPATPDEIADKTGSKTG